MRGPLIKNPQGFSFGYHQLTAMGDELDTRMNLGVLKLRAGEHYDIGSGLESALLLLSGKARFDLDQNRYEVRRDSIFDQSPYGLSLPAHSSAKISAHEDCELMLLETDNHKKFAPRFFNGDNILENEHRGQGLLNDTAYRMVRTIFDKRNHPDSNLVLGEVITFPGRWSSYPPHHHAQPEIYHYRFTEPAGYGHAELGDHVYKVHHFDTIKILDENDHAQVSAPGYGMYYMWAIRHLENNPYTVPTFTKEHAWTKDKGANARVWQS